MEQVLKSFQITLLDILAILFPGAVWFFLFFTGLNIFASNDFYVSPVSTWELILQQTSGERKFFLVFFGILISYLTGYVFKPQSMVWAEWLIINFKRLIGWNWKTSMKELKFPYPSEFRDKVYYIKLSNKIEGLIDFPSSELFGSGLFKVSQTLIRLKSPILKEEIDRREIEVRLIGNLFLASFLSLLLSLISFIFVKVFHSPFNLVIFRLWAVSSFILIFLLGAGFRRLRKLEVGYVYTHALIFMNLEERQNNTNS